jgi:hypothetical protein
VKKIRRIDVVIYECIVGFVSEVVKSQPERPPVVQERSRSFKVEIETEVARKFPLIGFAYLLSLIVVGRKPETIPPLEEINNRIVLGDRENSPVQKPVGRIPR